MKLSISHLIFLLRSLRFNRFDRYVRMAAHHYLLERHGVLPEIVWKWRSHVCQIQLQGLFIYGSWKQCEYFMIQLPHRMSDVDANDVSSSVFLLQSQFTKCVVVCCCCARWHFSMKFIYIFAVVVSFLISSKCFLCVSTSNMTIWLETKIKFVDSFLSEFHFSLRFCFGLAY